ncbi:MAG: hypothetical protein A2X46_12695 [Lentisphaerae bacterium GWF2_57_35]|nr:MAG: hypothetical protein A2X46_12695 [Lentisphaerae bacterium GWF2_57_35]
MTTIQRFFWLFLGLLTCTVFGENNTFMLVSGVTSNMSSSYSLGVAGTNNTLLVTNAGVFNAGGGALVGFMADANKNLATVTGSGSLWTLGSALFLGYAGSYNELTVAAGGRVINSNTTVIGSDSTAGRNRVSITGNGSAFFNTDRPVFVGYQGDGNGVTVSNRGLLRTQQLSLGEYAGAESNELLVVGFNSSVVCGSNLVCGATGSWNRVELRDSGYLQDVLGCIGSDAAASYNSVRVSSAVWSNDARLTVGRQGSFNSLLVSTGGYVLCQGEGFIGEESSAIGNAVLVDQGWLVVSNSFCIGAQGASNRLEVRNGGILGCFTDIYVGDAPGGSSTAHKNEALATGVNTRWLMQGSLYVGRGAVGNQVEVKGGALMQNSNAFIGAKESILSSNRIAISESGTVWSNTGEVWLQGPNNSVLVSGGAKAYAAASRIGSDVPGESPGLYVFGANSEWNCNDSFGVAFYGSDGHAVISEGARLNSGSGTIGLEAGDQAGLVLITDAGSVWTNEGNLTLGYYGSENALWVQSGAHLYSEAGRIGVYSPANNNLAWIDGGGSVWSCGDLRIGCSRGNELRISKNGRVACTNAVLGVGPGNASTGNLIRIMGSGSTLTNSGALIVGLTGAGNRLSIEAGGRVDTASFCVGHTNSASNNVVFVQTNGLLAVNGLAEIRRGAMYLNQGTVACSNLIVQTNAVLSGVGTLDLLRVDGYGTTVVGQPLGRMTVNGSFFQKPGSTLSLDLAGMEPGVSYDQLYVTNAFGIEGTLTVARTTGFIPQSNALFHIIPYEVHTLSGFSGTNLPAWFNWQLFSSPSGMMLRVTGVQAATNDVPKAWLVDYGWTNNFDEAALGDQDSDHVPTWQEYFAGTNPTNSSSVFQCLEIYQESLPSPGTVLRWQPVAGHVYAVDCSTNLLAPAWLELTNQLSAAVNSWTDAVIHADNGQYRLRVKPQ